MWKRTLICATLVWSVLTTVLLHWLPLSGYVDRSTPGNDYLIDQALSWLPFPSPYKHMPTIEALAGPGWGESVGIAILIALAAWALWLLWPLTNESFGSRGSADGVDHG